MCHKKHLEIEIAADIIRKTLDNDIEEASLQLGPYLADIESYDSHSRHQLKKLAADIETKRKARYEKSKARLKKSRRHSTF